MNLCHGLNLFVPINVAERDELSRVMMVIHAEVRPESIARIPREEQTLTRSTLIISFISQ